MSEAAAINDILIGLNPQETTEEILHEYPLSDLVYSIHRSLLYSQHKIRIDELNELKRNLTVDEDEDDTIIPNQYTSNKLKINDDPNNDPVEYKIRELVKQNSLTIGDTNVKLKVNLGNIIKKDDITDVLVSKYDETAPGISTELDIKLNTETNLELPNSLSSTL